MARLGLMEGDHKLVEMQSNDVKEDMVCACMYIGDSVKLCDNVCVIVCSYQHKIKRKQ